MKLNLSDMHRKILSMHSMLPYGAVPGKALPPLIVQIDVTYRCNLRCKMCFQHKTVNKDLELTASEIKSITDQLPFWTVMTFSGGEPFIRTDFREILEYALTRRKCNILTNAELVTDQDIRMLIKGKLLVMGISLDGIGAVHDRIRNKQGLFDKVVRTVETVQKEKKAADTPYPYIDIKTVILRDNISGLWDLYEMARKLGADFFSLSLLKLSSKQFTGPYYDDLQDVTPREAIFPQELNENERGMLTEQIKRIKGAGNGPKLRFYPYGMLNHGPIMKYYDNKISKSDFLSCRMPWSLLCISPYGDVFPCLSHRVGSTRNAKIADIWNGKKYGNFRRQLKEKGIFPNCLGCCYLNYKE